MRLARFEARHLSALRLQPAQAHLIGTLADDDYGARLEQLEGFTALDDEGRVIACAGLEPRWDNVATAWALLSCDAGPHLRGVIKALQGYIDHVAPWRRIEAAVDVGFVPGERLMRMLGFEREGLAKSYRPDGGDCTIWARIRA